LKRHEQLGIMRSDPDDYFATLPEEAVKAGLTELHETIDPSIGVEDLREQLKIVRFISVALSLRDRRAYSPPSFSCCSV